MTGWIGLLLCAQMVLAQPASFKAASKFEPNVKWQPKSVVSGDFTCEGHRQQAILGIDAKDLTVVAVFIHGLNSKPEVLTFRKGLESVKLEVEDLDYDPDYDLPGFRKSVTCKGLIVSDNEADPSHFYWNRDAHVFGGWSN